MENNAEYNLEPQDRISFSNTAKGLLQFEIRINRKMDSNEAIDKMIELQEYAIKKIRAKFPNTVWANEYKAE